MDTSLLALETYQYTSLRPVHSTFRLLKLLKYQGPELECELFQQSLLNDEYTPYEALSYVWGSNELVECIILDGKRLWVTDNLHSALQYLRLRDRDRYLWIDAICINQADKEEQSRQVQQMGAIYKYAKRVLVWLGKATSEIITLMEALHQLQRTGEKWNFEQPMPDSGRSNIYRTGLRQLLNRQWFTRVWILQEVANAQKATICCGTQSISANVFSQAPFLIGEKPEPHCQAVLDIMPGISRSGSWWGQERDLYTLFSRFQASKATDERDKIYALLGLSSNPVDIKSIDIDYQQPTHKVIHKAITYLLQSAPISIHEVLNLMTSFVTLDTVCFVPVVREKKATEILFPYLQSGEKLGRSLASENISRGIPIVNNTLQLSFEKRPEGSLKDHETCYSEVVKLMLDVRTSETLESQSYNDGLQVIPWGSVEQHVKLLVVHDRRSAILKAAMQSCGHIVNKLLHMEIGEETGKQFEESALEEAIKQGHRMAVQTILQQSSRVHIQHGMYDKLFQKAAGKGNQEVMALLLDQRGDEVQITQEVVIAAAGNHYGEEVITLLLNQRGDNMQITQEAVASIAQHFDEEVMTLLLDRRGDDVQITQEVVVAAAGNRYGEEVMTLLLDRRGDEIQITQKVVVAATGNHYGKEVMALLIDRRGDEVQITQEVVVAAAGNYYHSKEVMTLLLDRRGDEIQITQKVVVVAAENRNGKEVITLLLNQRGDNMQITQQVVVSIAQHFDEEVIMILLNRRGDDVQITQEMVVAAVWNRNNKEVITLLLNHHGDHMQITHEAVVSIAQHFNKEVMTLLLDRRGDEVQITQEVVVAAAGNRYGKGVMALLIDRRGDEVQITQEVVVAATGNRYGEEVMALLINQHGNEVQITQEVVVAAAGNDHNGKEVMKLLLDRRGDDVQITQEVVVAAARNYYNGKEVMALLLDQRGDEVQITQEVVVAAAGNDHNGEEVMKLLLDRRGDDVQITQEVVVAAARNYYNGKEVMALLLDQRGDEVQITQEVVVAAAGNDHNGEEVMKLLLDRRGDDVQITQEVVVAAAGNEDGGRVIKYLRQITSIHITKLMIQSAATSGQENTLRLFGQWAKDSIVTKDWINIARFCAATKEGNAKLILGLFQQGVPPDERDIWGRTPLWRAARNGHADTVQVLLATHAVDVNAADIHKRTPLFWPAAYGDIEVVRLLLDHGAKQNYEDIDRRSPFTIAQIYGQTKMLQILADNNI